MSRTRTGVRHGSQPPADCKVYGQEESRSPWLAIICIFIGAAVAVAWLA